MPNVDWLLREALNERTLKTGERMALDDEQWQADIERLQIGPGLRVFLTDAKAKRDITVEARDDRADQWMGSQVTIAGRAEIDFLDGQKTYSSTDQALLFRPSGRKAAYSIRAGGRFHSAGYGLSVERVRRLFEGEVPGALRSLLTRRVAASLVLPMRAGRPMRHAAKSLFGRGFNGPLRILMMEGAVLQLLAIQAAAMASQPEAKKRRPLLARERALIGEAREQLLADMRNPPTLGGLSVTLGITEKRLNAGFVALFGATMFTLLRDERLEHARIALGEGAPLKEVASRVGYNHVTNFISAFTARYGAPPARYSGRARR